MAMCLAMIIILYKKRGWGWLWEQWLTSTDPKKIGTMYMIFSAVMFFRGLVDAGMIWVQQSMGADSQGYLSAESFSTDFYLAWRYYGVLCHDGVFFFSLEFDELDYSLANWSS